MSNPHNHDRPALPHDLLPDAARKAGGIAAWSIAAVLLSLHGSACADHPRQAQQAIYYKSGPAAPGEMRPGLQKTPYITQADAATKAPRFRLDAQGAECLPFGNVTLCFAATRSEGSARVL